jgi:hypothetical protein
MNAPSFDLAVAADQFDSGVFEEDELNQDDDEISLGSEDEDDGASLECDVEGEGVAREASDIGPEDEDGDEDGDEDDDNAEGEDDKEEEEEDEDVIYECPSRPLPMQMVCILIREMRCTF